MGCTFGPVSARHLDSTQTAPGPMMRCEGSVYTARTVRLCQRRFTLEASPQLTSIQHLHLSMGPPYAEGGQT